MIKSCRTLFFLCINRMSQKSLKVCDKCHQTICFCIETLLQHGTATGSSPLQDPAVLTCEPISADSPTTSTATGDSTIVGGTSDPEPRTSSTDVDNLTIPVSGYTNVNLAEGFQAGISLTVPKDQFKDSPSKPSQSKKKKRPNYFIGFKITDEKIHKNASELQACILLSSPILQKSMVPIPTLHITLLVMQIGSNEELVKAHETLKLVFDKYNQIVYKSPIQLEFEELGHFQHRVLFMKVKPGENLERLKTLANDIRSQFQENEINFEDDPFTPHLTILKFSRDPSLRSQGVKKIAPSLYSSKVKDNFGNQTIESLQFLKMEKDDTGYYVGNELRFNLQEEEK